MMKCPECNKELRWVGDEVILDDNILETVYDCHECFIDVIKRIRLNKLNEWEND